MGASSMGIGVSDPGVDSLWLVSTRVSSVIVVWASGVVAWVAEPEATGIGGMPVTCLLLVSHLLPIRAQKTLEIKPWLFSTCNSLTCPSRNSKHSSST